MHISMYRCNCKCENSPLNYLIVKVLRSFILDYIGFCRLDLLFGFVVAKRTYILNMLSQQFTQ